MSAVDIKELLPLYALGVLDGGEMALVERAAASDPAIAAELASFQAATDSLVIPVTPPSHIKAQLLASVGGGRFEKFAKRLATMYDVTVERACELLGLTDRPASWEAQMIPGVHLVHFDGGPAYANADCGFVRIAVGATFPPHTHMGEEMSLVIQGRVRDASTGLVLVPGDELLLTEATGHYLVCEGDEECIFAARAMNGIAIAGASVRPNRR
jgi:anti-sigma factor ChrR (cupin superfamily)